MCKGAALRWLRPGARRRVSGRACPRRRTCFTRRRAADAPFPKGRSGFLRRTYFSHNQSVVRNIIIGAALLRQLQLYLLDAGSQLIQVQATAVGLNVFLHRFPVVAHAGQHQAAGILRQLHAHRAGRIAEL